MSSYFQGKITAGPNGNGDSAAGKGAVLMRQFKEIAFDADLVAEAEFNIPVGSDIVDIIADPLVSFNSATSAILSVGSESGGTQYASGVDAKATARVRPTFTQAQLNAHDGLTSSAVFATITSVGQPSAGLCRVTILYEQGNNA